MRSRMVCTLCRLPPERGSSESNTVTWAPNSRQRCARLLPMKPRPPVTSTFCPRNEGAAPLLALLAAVAFAGFSACFFAMVRPRSDAQHGPHAARVLRDFRLGDVERRRQVDAAVGHVVGHGMVAARRRLPPRKGRQ